MSKPNSKIQIFEWGWLTVNQVYDGIIFKQHHLDALAKYEQLSGTEFFRCQYSKLRFNQYVGVIKVGDLTIEVLPKTDKHQLDKGQWQKVLLEMLLISLQVEAKTTTNAAINIRQHSVLDTYMQLFLNETEKLIHQGLIKKYRTNISNQTTLKGKLLVHQQITKNAVHAERFYVAHTVYVHDHVHNFILRAGLECIAKTGSNPLKRNAEALLLFFPECNKYLVNDKLFKTLSFDRKSEDYKKGVELARIILLNYHPDIKGGSNDILAIMFDMNYLWESFVYWSLKKATLHLPELQVFGQKTKVFWKKEAGWSMRLKPDLVIESTTSNVVIDTKWKYQSSVTPDDLRQIYAYLDYFESDKGYLLYPEQLGDYQVSKKEGHYQLPDGSSNDNKSCGLMFADLIINNKLNKDIGEAILESLQFIKAKSI
ncbi:MAG: restriction endonuclease [Reichenbachiella sp.]|uniref:McrC family protein n=1 Tax=Reichenbachiella sp. TaxID=2184521 RepID=UPI00329786AB